jgi:chromosome segregation ATPase
MLDRLNLLEEKLDALLKRFGEFRKDLASREEESRLLKAQTKGLRKDKKGLPESDQDCMAVLKKERDQFAEQLRKVEEENNLLKMKLTSQEKELENKTALEEETLGKLRDIITRINALEAEIGELEHEQIDPDDH